MTQNHRRARLATILGSAAVAVCAFAPATASAVNITLTDDNGTPTPWSGEPALRHMNPTAEITFATNEKGYYSATFIGPDGGSAATAVKCYSIPIKRAIDYRGNGAYSVTIVKYGEKDHSCATPVAQQAYRFSINASVALSGPPTRVLTRAANSVVTTPVNLNFAGNPGSVAPEIRYSLNGAVGPDGGLTTPSAEAYVDPATGLVPLRLTAPGRYVAVARAKGFTTPNGNFFSPWTPPVIIDAVAPFDLERLQTPDSRGPSYRIRVQIGERTARGRVSISIARGSKGGRYRSLGSVKISSKATISKRFRLTRSGTYRMRFKFKGSSTVAAGTAVAKFRVSRRFAF